MLYGEIYIPEFGARLLLRVGASLRPRISRRSLRPTNDMYPVR
jgi:hypothetical protein